jgi:hypothetical protein
VRDHEALTEEEKKERRECEFNVVGVVLLVALAIIFCGILRAITMADDPPPPPIAVSVDINRVGECPAPVGFDGRRDHWSRQLWKWRNRVIRSLPENRTHYCWSTNYMPTVVVVSKSKGRITLYLDRLNPVEGFLFPNVLDMDKIVVE